MTAAQRSALFVVTVLLLSGCKELLGDQETACEKANKTCCIVRTGPDTSSAQCVSSASECAAIANQFPATGDGYPKAETVKNHSLCE